MGTRSITHLSIIENGIKHRLCTFYRQYDGYPQGHGLEMAEFLNGFSDKPVPYNKSVIGLKHNGFDDMAFQLLAVLKMKMGPLGLYLCKPGTSGMGAEYTYDVCFNEETKEVIIKVIPEFNTTDAFEGTVQEFVSRFGQDQEEANPIPQFEDGAGY